MNQHTEQPSAEDIQAIDSARELLLSSAYKRLGYDIWQKLAECGQPGYSQFVAWSADERGKVSYAAKPEDKYSMRRRRRLTLQRYLSRQCGVEIAPHIDNAVAQMIAECHYDPSDFELRADVAACYVELAGTIGSCMSSNPRGCLAFYEHAGARVLTWRKQARALVWKLDDGRTFIDRLYSSSPCFEHYKRYAREHNAILRDHDSQSALYGASVTIPAGYHGAYPYLDTLTEYETKTRKLTYDGAGTTLQTTGGYYLGDDGDSEGDCNCPRCGGACWEDDMRSVDGDYVCEGCYEDSNYCDRCEESTFADVSRIDGQYCCDSCAESANCCDHCNESTFADLATVDDESWCESCWQDDATSCADCDELTADATCSDVDNECRCCACHERHLEDTADDDSADDNQASQALVAAFSALAIVCASLN